MSQLVDLVYTPWREPYFMSEEQKDAVVGRVMREYKENEENIGRLLAEAQKLGNRLIAIGEGLAQHPEGVHLTRAGLDTKHSRVGVGYDPSDFEVALITALTNDYRSALEARANLERQLAQLGFPPSR